MTREVLSRGWELEPHIISDLTAEGNIDPLANDHSWARAFREVILGWAPKSKQRKPDHFQMKI